MSGLRCWPGALAYITHPSMFGRMVEVVHAAPVGAVFKLPDGYGQFPVPEAGYWVVKALGQPFDVPCENGCLRRAPYAVIPDRWLRPILPPPEAESESTDDRAEIDQGAPMFAG